jgi:hypothetical protein
MAVIVSGEAGNDGIAVGSAAFGAGQGQPLGHWPPDDWRQIPATPRSIAASGIMPDIQRV